MDHKDKQAPLDTQLFRRVMGRFATGVTVITTEGDGAVRGMTANAFMSGSLSPMLCLISVAKKARLHDALIASGHFGVSMLAHDQEAISKHFAGQGSADPDILFEHLASVPVLARAVAAVTATIEARHECGDHTLFIGRVTGLRDDERAPLVYSGGRYATLHVKHGAPADPMIDFWELEPN
jgi:flavin reductase (DIM6/NTAB) family NADH-FMN oxidoreductase RutF